MPGTFAPRFSKAWKRGAFFSNGWKIAGMSSAKRRAPMQSVTIISHSEFPCEKNVSLFCNSFVNSDLLVS